MTEDRNADHMTVYGVTGLNSDLPERADMPRITDERTMRTITMPTAKCGRTEAHTAHRYGVRESEWCAGNVDAIIGDTRNGSQVTR